MGGGRKYFRPDSAHDEEYPGVKGDRADGQDLTQMWIDRYSNESAHYVWNASAFNNIDPLTTDRLLGEKFIS